MRRERSKRLRSRDSHTLGYSAGARCGKEFFPRASTESFRSSSRTAKAELSSLRQRPRSALAQRAQAPGRGWREGQTARAYPRRSGCSDSRQSPEDFQEPPSTSFVHHRPGKRLKRLRGFVGFKLCLFWWKGRPHRWATSWHVSQAVLLCWAQAEEQPR